MKYLILIDRAKGNCLLNHVGLLLLYEFCVVFCPFISGMAEPILKNMYSKTCVRRPLSKRPKIGFQDQLLLNADQLAPREHSAILLTFTKLCNTFDLH